jgi:hypothetical protein
MTGDLAGALLHGPDAGLVALRRRQLVNFLTDGDDLRLTRLEPGVAQKDPAGIDAALRARGFFPGRRVVLIGPDQGGADQGGADQGAPDQGAPDRGRAGRMPFWWSRRRT